MPLNFCLRYVVDLIWISVKRLASASYDGTARIWDAESGECAHELVGHQVRQCISVLLESEVIV